MHDPVLGRSTIFTCLHRAAIDLSTTLLPTCTTEVLLRGVLHSVVGYGAFLVTTLGHLLLTCCIAMNRAIFSHLRRIWLDRPHRTRHPTDSTLILADSRNTFSLFFFYSHFGRAFCMARSLGFASHVEGANSSFQSRIYMGWGQLFSFISMEGASALFQRDCYGSERLDRRRGRITIYD
jgi:hypothetical protein